MKRIFLITFIAVFLLLSLCSCQNKEIVIDTEESFYSNYKIEDDKVYFYCNITINNPTGEEPEVELIGLFGNDAKIGLLKKVQLKGYMSDCETSTFKLKEGDNSFEVVFIGEYGGYEQKADRLLPEIQIIRKDSNINNVENNTQNSKEQAFLLLDSSLQKTLLTPYEPSTYKRMLSVVLYPSDFGSFDSLREVMKDGVDVMEETVQMRVKAYQFEVSFDGKLVAKCGELQGDDITKGDCLKNIEQIGSVSISTEKIKELMADIPDAEFFVDESDVSDGVGIMLEYYDGSSSDENNYVKKSLSRHLDSCEQIDSLLDYILEQSPIKYDSSFTLYGYGSK